MQAVYHADFVQNIRGTVTSMPEDNEMKRAREVGNIVSQSAYTRGQGGEDSHSTPAATRSGSQCEDTGKFGCEFAIKIKLRVIKKISK